MSEYTYCAVRELHKGGHRPIKINFCFSKADLDYMKEVALAQSHRGIHRLLWDTYWLLDEFGDKVSHDWSYEDLESTIFVEGHLLHRDGEYLNDWGEVIPEPQNPRDWSRRSAKA